MLTIKEKKTFTADGCGGGGGGGGTFGKRKGWESVEERKKSQLLSIGKLSFYHVVTEARETDFSCSFFSFCRRERHLWKLEREKYCLNETFTKKEQSDMFLVSLEVCRAKWPNTTRKTTTAGSQRGKQNEKLVVIRMDMFDIDWDTSVFAPH